MEKTGVLHNYGSPLLSPSLGQFLFYRRVGTVTRHLRSVTFYFTDESEPSLVIISEAENRLLFSHLYYIHFAPKMQQVERENF